MQRAGLGAPATYSVRSLHVEKPVASHKFPARRSVRRRVRQRRTSSFMRPTDVCLYRATDTRRHSNEHAVRSELLTHRTQVRQPA